MVKKIMHIFYKFNHWIDYFFFGLAFNEFIILYFWGLDKDTHLQIVKRSAKDEKSIDLEDIIGVDDNDDEN